jgi:hypothetical protein
MRHLLIQVRWDRTRQPAGCPGDPTTERYMEEARCLHSSRSITSAKSPICDASVQATMRSWLL